jgi:alpha-D-ribose 1-methylphosphonate 5-triphosphate synthase subunit PhnL
LTQLNVPRPWACDPSCVPAGNGGSEPSGGEQQLLAISGALMTNTDLLVIDEATDGLEPLIRQGMWASIATLKCYVYVDTSFNWDTETILHF